MASFSGGEELCIFKHRAGIERDVSLGPKACFWRYVQQTIHLKANESGGSNESGSGGKGVKLTSLMLPDAVIQITPKKIDDKCPYLNDPMSHHGDHREIRLCFGNASIYLSSISPTSALNVLNFVSMSGGVIDTTFLEEDVELHVTGLQYTNDAARSKVANMPLFYNTHRVYSEENYWDDKELNPTTVNIFTAIFQ